MKFAELGNWSVRIDRIVAVNIWEDKHKVTIYCDDGKEYPMTFRSIDRAREAHATLMEALEKN